MNNYFCVLPFYGYEIPHYSYKNIHCCRLAPGTDIAIIQDSIHNKQRNPACSTCWKLEDSGLTSERQLHNQAFDFYLDRDLDKIEQDTIDGLHSPQIVKLATSNLCNGTCVTCDSISSSAWAALEGKQIQYQVMPTAQLDKIDWAKTRQLSFVGGEPLLERANFDILNRLIELGNTSCFISVVTNGSRELTHQQLDVLAQFPNLNMCVSIDGIGPRFEYMRYPLKWSLLEQNLKHFKKIARYLSVSCMISNLNIAYYTEMIDFFKQHQLEYLCKQIDSPSYFSPGNLSPADQQQVLDLNPRYQSEIQGFFTTGQYSPELFAQCQDEIARQDQLKKISIVDFMPVNFVTST